MKRTCVGLLLICLASSAAASDEGRIGVDLEVGARRLIGMSYHITDRIALRPGLFFQTSTAENTPSFVDPTQAIPVYETEETSLGGQLEVDYFLSRRRRELSPYVSTTFGYTHINSQYPVSDGDTLLLRKGNLHNWSIGAGFGVQYALSDAFNVFGQVGLSYFSGERFTVNGVKLKSHSLGTSTSAIGAVFYFN